MVDVRSPQEFAEGHVAGSVNIPLNQIEDRLDEFEGKKYILVCCRSGRRSGEAKALLEKHKIRNVVNGGSWANIRKLVEKNDK